MSHHLCLFTAWEGISSNFYEVEKSHLYYSCLHLNIKDTCMKSLSATHSPRTIVPGQAAVLLLTVIPSLMTEIAAAALHASGCRMGWHCHSGAGAVSELAG